MAEEAGDPRICLRTAKLGCGPEPRLPQSTATLNHGRRVRGAPGVCARRMASVFERFQGGSRMEYMRWTVGAVALLATGFAASGRVHAQAAPAGPARVSPPAAARPAADDGWQAATV